MSRTYHFGDYRVNPALRELWQGDRLIALPPHVFDCLVYLLERHDRAVGRDELVAAVWGKTEVSDTLLGQTVLRLRRELGDDAKDQRVLRTIPRFGYRWVAALEAAETASSDRAAEQTPVSLAPRRHSPLWSMIGALALAATIGIAWAWLSHKPAKIAAPVGSSMIAAVLPAGVESGTEWAWMRLGVMDIVAARLRSSGMPSVPSEDVVALLKVPVANRNADLREALAVRLLVTPRVQRDAGNWQVQLDADDGAGQHYAVQAQAHEADAAARAAADRLLVAVGLQPATTMAESSPDAILIKRIDAAVLADDPDAARTLIAQASAEEQQAPQLRVRLAKIDFRAGRLDAARERLVALLDEAPAKTAPVLRASVLNGLGAVAIRADQPQDAERSFAAAIGLLESRNEPAELGQAYLGRAAAAAEQRHYDDAAADYARARIALRQANDTLALIRVAANEGFVDLDLGRPTQALPELTAATEGFKQWGALNEAILTSIGQIGCHLALLDGRSALQAADATAAFAQRIDNPSTIASLTFARARALAAVGRLRESRELLAPLRGDVDPATSAASAGVLAQLELDSGNLMAAEELALRAVANLDAPSYVNLRASAWLTQVRAAARAGAARRARDASSAFAQWAEHTEATRAQLFARLAQAETTLRFDQSKTWRDDFEAAREMAARSGVPYEVATVARSYADALLSTGDLPAAEVEVGRVSRWSEQDFDCAVLEARLYAALGRDSARQTAVARARAVAGERTVPPAALAVAIATPPAN
jgi:DNA-binding winged helix-turn-helix (wHTH) protein